MRIILNQFVQPFLIIPPIRDFLIDFAKYVDISFSSEMISVTSNSNIGSVTEYVSETCSGCPCDALNRVRDFWLVIIHRRRTRFATMTFDSARESERKSLVGWIWAVEGGYHFSFLFSRATILAKRACMVGLLIWEVTVRGFRRQSLRFVNLDPPFWICTTQVTFRFSASG